jgi:Fe-S cluster assembly iron-binding protein IscA
MFTVTTSAEGKLKEALQESASEPEQAIRIMPSPSKPDQLALAVDEEREGDEVVKDQEGSKLLLIGTNVSPVLDGMTMDYQETPQGSSFVLSQNPSAG